MCTNKDKIFFKYRSLENFENFLDILLCNRLYGCSYDKLNDPMECSFHNFQLQLTDAEKKVLYEKRKNLFICSLSKTRSDSLMWSHYADGHRGCCIALEVSRTPFWKQIDVEYHQNMPSVQKGLSIDEILKKCYSIKSSFWEYEKEIRYVKNGGPKNSHYLPVRIHAVYLGWKISSKHKTMITHVVNLLNQKRSQNNKIELYQMNSSNIVLYQI